MQDNKESGNKMIIVNSRINAILKKLDEIVDKHPEIVLKKGTYDYSKAPPEVRAEVDLYLEEIANIHYEEVFWHLAEYYYLREADPSQIDSSLAEYLLTEKENGMAFIPDSVIEDILDRFPELKKVHPKIYETLGQKFIEITEEKEFYLWNVRDEEVQHMYREIENIAKSGVKGVKVVREKGAVHVKYTDAPAEVKKVLDETVEKIEEKLTEIMVYRIASYYYTMLNDPSRLEFRDAQIAIYAKTIGLNFIPNDVAVDALNRFPELRELYPEIAEKYKKFLK